MSTEAQSDRRTLAYHHARVTAVTRITPHMARITLEGESFASVESAAPDQYVKVFFPLPGQDAPVLPPRGDDVMAWYRTYLAMSDDVRPPMRTYTVRALRPERSEVDIDFVLHSDTGGPASAWAAQAKVGDRVALVGPNGLYAVPEGTDWQLLIGDESALPAIGAIVEELPASAKARVYVEISGPEGRQRLETNATVELHWIHRGTRPHGEAVLDAVRAATLPGGAPYVWLSGEASLVKFTRRHLVRDRGIDKSAILFTGYWRQGLSEDAASREVIRAAEAGETPLDD